MARKQQKRHNRGSDRRKTAHAHRSTRHMQPVRTQKTVRRRLPEAEVRRRQRARRRQFALLGLAVLLIVLIFAFRHLISTPQQSGADGDTGNSGTSATEEVKQVAKAVNVYQSVMYYQPVVQKYAEQNGIPEYTDVLLAIMQVESGGKLTDIMQSSGSAGLPNDSLEEESSIRQGCTYFAHLLSKGKSLDCDLDCIIQAYNYGSGFLDYAAKFNGVCTAPSWLRNSRRSSPAAIPSSMITRWQSRKTAAGGMPTAICSMPVWLSSIDRVIVFYALFGQNYLTNRL